MNLRETAKHFVQLYAFLLVGGVIFALIQTFMIFPAGLVAGNIHYTLFLWITFLIYSVLVPFLYSFFVKIKSSKELLILAISLVIFSFLVSQLTQVYLLKILFSSFGLTSPALFLGYVLQSSPSLSLLGAVCFSSTSLTILKDSKCFGLFGNVLFAAFLFALLDFLIVFVFLYFGFLLSKPKSAEEVSQPT